MLYVQSLFFNRLAKDNYCINVQSRPCWWVLAYHCLIRFIVSELIYLSIYLSESKGVKNTTGFSLPSRKIWTLGQVPLPLLLTLKVSFSVI